MDVSVIIPCYNEAHCLRDCLKSVMRQTLADYEVIVVDDGSTDASTDIARQFPVRLLQASHKGPGMARNLGARSSSGNILVFLDADMVFEPDYLERMVAPIQRGETVGTIHVDERVANPRNPWAHCWTLHSGLPIGYRIAPNSITESTVFRAILRTAFDQAGGYGDVGYGEDTTISARLGILARAVEGAVCYHHNPGSMIDVFYSARWIGRGLETQSWRALLPALPPISFLKGLRGAWRYRCLAYAVFRPVYDFGLLCGAVSRRFGGDHFK